LLLEKWLFEFVGVRFCAKSGLQNREIAVPADVSISATSKNDRGAERVFK